MSYNPPTPTEVRLMFKALELTGSEVAKQCGLKNSRLVRKYTADNSSNATLPYSVLFTLVAKNLGRFVSVDGWRDDLIEEGILHRKKLDCIRE